MIVEDVSVSNCVNSLHWAQRYIAFSILFILVSSGNVSRGLKFL